MIKIEEVDWQSAQLSRNQLDEARPLIQRSPSLPLRFAASSGSDLVSFCLTDLAGTLRQSGGVAFTAYVDATLAGMLVLADLPWESEILARRMSVLKYLFLDETLDCSEVVANHLLQGAVRLATRHSVSFLLSKVYTDNHTAIHALEANGFRLVETALNYVYDCRRGLVAEDCAANSETRIRRAEQTDVDHLVTVARAAFHSHAGRFHVDPRLSADEAVRIYEEWIRSSCNGYADAIFLAERRSKIGGFSIWKEPSNSEKDAGIRSAHYSIGAVAPEFQGQGVFRALTLAGMRLYNHWDLIEGPTNLRNTAVQHAYQALGWKLRDSQYTFHRWL